MGVNHTVAPENACGGHNTPDPLLWQKEVSIAQEQHRHPAQISRYEYRNVILPAGEAELLSV